MINSEVRSSIKHALTGYREGDRPILEELGVDFSAIKRDSLRIFLVNSHFAKETDDMVGPILFLALYGALLVLRGRVHIGHLYYLSALSCIFVYGVTVLMNSTPVSALGVVNALGYSLIPVLIFTVGTHVMPSCKTLRILIGCGFSLWATAVAAVEITRRFRIEEKGILIGYPIFLVFTCLVILSVV
ncbi:protein YIPF5/7 [Nematocida major]|uniref:protein YIPF5/7 n=1 Tax=Nematocida major TaxID=1912982 RepID=UPI00200814AA|nr:protein YIPF5/7 [Nematocida major]KAH9386933.1 protein YIPF5/7 [Nematocida major]